MSSEPVAVPPAGLLLRAGKWETARDELRERLAQGPDGAAFEGLAQTFWWLDDGTRCLEAREDAYHFYRDSGQDPEAARAASALGYDSLLFGEGEVVARGWMGRAEQLLSAVPERAEHGWLALRRGELALATQGDPALAEQDGERACAIGRRVDDPNLTYAGMALSGLARTTAGHPESGLPQLDAAVAAATTGEVDDLMWMGKIFCWLIIACQQTHDLSRADEWCRRVEAVCERRHLDPLFTVCRIQHASVLIERGTWPQAESTLAAVLERVETSRRHTRLDAVVQLGELRRRQGRFAEAEELLAQAEFDPSAIVSLALVRLARGEAAPAWAEVRQVLARTPPANRLQRARLLLPAVRAALAAGDRDAAQDAADELRETAASIGNTPTLGLAAAAAATLAPPAESVGAWREAVRSFHESALPFDEAESRLGLAGALLHCGEIGAAEDQLSKASTLLEALGAHGVLTEADRLRRQIASARGTPHAVLSEREREVLRCVADGLTDQQIADALTLSPHTVHRHVAHILTKVGQPTRAAAVAHALTHGLL
jgi:ATP/maltotriose-dependent transcriptional regulator MalT